MINDKYNRIESEAVIRARALLLDCISTYRLYDMGASSNGGRTITASTYRLYDKGVQIISDVRKYKHLLSDTFKTSVLNRSFSDMWAYNKIQSTTGRPSDDPQTSCVCQRIHD